MIENPIFVGGLFKSGTSLLRAMISKHSNIVGGLETYWFELDFKLKLARNGEDFFSYAKRIAQFFEMDEDFVLSIIDNSSKAEEFLSKLLDEKASRECVLRWVEKTPGNLQNLDRIFGYWPNAKFIHIIRDPRDVYVSFLKTRADMNPDAFKKQWNEWIPPAEDMCRKLKLSQEQYLEIRYESLVLDPENVMREVMSFLGEAWEDSLGHFEGQQSDYALVKNLTGKSSPTLERLAQPLMSSQIGVWAELPQREIQLLNEGSMKNFFVN